MPTGSLNHFSICRSSLEMESMERLALSWGNAPGGLRNCCCRCRATSAKGWVATVLPRALRFCKPPPEPLGQRDVPLGLSVRINETAMNLGSLATERNGGLRRTHGVHRQSPPFAHPSEMCSIVSCSAGEGPRIIGCSRRQVPCPHRFHYQRRRCCLARCSHREAGLYRTGYCQTDRF